MDGAAGEEVAERLPLYRIPALRNLLAIRFSSNAAHQMLGVIVGWQVYEITGSALDLGLIGLAQFLPPLALTLAAGQIADNYDRRLILTFSYVVQAAAAALLVLLALMQSPPVGPIYLILFVNGVARTFEMPAVHAMLPHVLPRDMLGRAIPAYSSVGKLANLTGPAIGGAVIALSGIAMAYAACLALIAIAFVANLMLASLRPGPSERDMSFRSALAGLEFIWKARPVLGAMSLDLMATLFGSIVAMLPIFARDILDVGPWGLGLLRSTPAIGALVMAAVLTRYPIERQAGAMMYASMAIYGAMTIVFGLSTSFWLSFVALLILGAGDMIGAVVRQTFIQLATPDDRRGRVLAVNTLFNSTAGQIGMVKSGIVAAFLGASGSVIFGGCAVFVVIGLWAWAFPALGKVDRPTELESR